MSDDETIDAWVLAILVVLTAGATGALLAFRRGWRP